jgi:hypothetical protein
VLAGVKVMAWGLMDVAPAEARLVPEIVDANGVLNIVFNTDRRQRIPLHLVAALIDWPRALPASAGMVPLLRHPLDQDETGQWPSLLASRLHASFVRHSCAGNGGPWLIWFRVYERRDARRRAGGWRRQAMRRPETTSIKSSGDRGLGGNHLSPGPAQAVRHGTGRMR